MLQRIQSLYLVISLVLFTAFFMNPLFFVTNPMGIFKIFSYKSGATPIAGAPSLFPLAISELIVIILLLISIFLFTRRKLQIRLIRLSLLVVLVSIVITAFAHYNFQHLSQTQASLTIWALAPFIVILLNFLSIKAIKKDQDLIDSLNRLR